MLFMTSISNSLVLAMNICFMLVLVLVCVIVWFNLNFDGFSRLVCLGFFMCLFMVLFGWCWVNFSWFVFRMVFLWFLRTGCVCRRVTLWLFSMGLRVSMLFSNSLDLLNTRFFG